LENVEQSAAVRRQLADKTEIFSADFADFADRQR